MEELARRLKTVNPKHLQIKLVKIEPDVRRIVFKPRGEYGSHAIEVVETLLNSGRIEEYTHLLNVNELQIHAINGQYSGRNGKILRLYAELKKLGFKEKESKY